MGREVRKVPANWDHPHRDPTSYPFDPQCFQPMHNRRFEDEFSWWLAEFDRIRAGDLDDAELECYSGPYPLAEWLQDDGRPPDPAYFRPWQDEDATWFQVWETVTEGTPVTPPFATKEELVDYLVKHGDFWQQKRWEKGDKFMQPTVPGYSRAAAEKFVMGDGWAPSHVIVHDEHGTRSASGIDIPILLAEVSK